jgi:hypothetical protein
MTEKRHDKATNNDKTVRTELLRIPDVIKQKLAVDFFVNVPYYFSENFAEIINIQKGDEELIKAKIESLDDSQVLYTKYSKCVLYSSIEQIINDLNAEVPIISDKLYSILELDLLLKSRGYYNLSEARDAIPKIYGGDLGHNPTYIYYYLGADIENFFVKINALAKKGLPELTPNPIKTQNIFTLLKHAMIRLFKKKTT